MGNNTIEMNIASIRLLGNQSFLLREIVCVQGDAEIWPLCTGTELNFRDRVLGEVEKNSFIASPGKRGHSGLMPSKLYVLTWRG